jgi:hypothetical protein
LLVEQGLREETEIDEKENKINKSINQPAIQYSNSQPWIAAFEFFLLLPKPPGSCYFFQLHIVVDEALAYCTVQYGVACQKAMRKN